MTARLNHQQLPAFFNNTVKLCQERSGIGHLMDDSCSKDEVRCIFQVICVKTVLPAYPRFNTAEEVLLFGFPVKPLNHLFLKVDTYDLAVWANHFRHRKAEKTHGAAHIYNCHSFCDIGGQSIHRIIEQFPQRTCKQVPHPYGAYVICQNPPPFLLNIGSDDHYILGIVRIDFNRDNFPDLKLS